MGKHVKGKSPLSALIPRDLALGVLRWLQRNPEYTRTDFAIKALSEKLRKYGIEVGDAVGTGEIVERRSQSSTKHVRPRLNVKSGKRLLVTAWMDGRILQELDKWRKKVRPRMTRTTFFIEAIAELLFEADMITEAQAKKHGAYAEYARSTEELDRLHEARERLDKKYPPGITTMPELLARAKALIAQLAAVHEAMSHLPPLPELEREKKP